MRQIRIPLRDLLVMIRHDYPKFSEFSEETAKSLANLPRGSCILFCDPETEESLKGRVKGMLVFPFFRANVSVSMLINKKESNSLLHRLTEN